MVLLPQRNPVYTAKEVSTLDWLSNGRVDLGIGVGWLEEEFDAVNVPWPQRGKRTDEYLEVLRTLWCDETSAYDGEFYSLNPCAMFPKPVQQPHPPIHIGGESDAALRRTARAGQGWHTFNRTPEDLAEPLATLDRLLADEGRTRSDITHHRLPVLPAARRRHRRAATPRPVPTPWPPCSCLRCRRRRSASTHSSRCSTGRRPLNLTVGLADERLTAWLMTACACR